MTQCEGRLVEWFPDRGFGFIAPNDGGPNVFLHVKNLPREDKRLAIGQAYSFDTVTDTRGRVQAKNAVPIIEPAAPTKRPRFWALGHIPPLLVIVAFLGIALAMSQVTRVSSNWWIVYGVASFGSFIGYWIDKNAAIAKKWRISETILLLLGLVGGWPGAIMAQEFFRHKTRKDTFRYLFWMTVAINMAAFVQINALGGI